MMCNCKKAQDCLAMEIAGRVDYSERVRWDGCLRLSDILSR